MDVTNKIRSVGIFSEECLLEILNERLSTNTKESFIVKAVFKKMDEEWDFLVGIIQVCEDHNEKQGVAEYSDYAFMRKQITYADLLVLIKHLQQDGYQLTRNPNLRLKCENDNSGWSWELMPSHATNKNYPAKRFSIKINQNACFADTPLIGFNMPFFKSSLEYIREFLGINSFNSDNSSICGSLLLDVYDFRYRILISDNILKLDGVDARACIVGFTPITESVCLNTDQALSFDPKDVFESELWLISSDNEVLDYRSQITWQYRIQKDDSSEEAQEKYLSMIKSGEGLYCEFKRFIDPQTPDNKSFELEKTVCAFSNAGGGMLFIGVNDEGVIEGVNDKLTKIYKATFEEALHQYCRELQKQLNETLKVNQCFDIQSVVLHTKCVIVISVDPVYETNYVLHKEQAFIRRGATSAKLAFIEERKHNRPGLDYF